MPGRPWKYDVPSTWDDSVQSGSSAAKWLVRNTTWRRVDRAQEGGPSEWPASRATDEMNAASSSSDQPSVVAEDEET